MPFNMQYDTSKSGNCNPNKRQDVPYDCDQLADSTVIDCAFGNNDFREIPMNFMITPIFVGKIGFDISSQLYYSQCDKLQSSDSLNSLRASVQILLTLIDSKKRQVSSQRKVFFSQILLNLM